MKQLSPRYANCLTFLISLFSLLNFEVQSQIITTIAGNGLGTYNGDSILSTQAQFLPTFIATDKAGNIYISDLDNSRIRKINRNGIITTVAGNGVSGFSGDGGLATAANLAYPWGIAFDSSGNLFICDDGESRIRKVNSNGIISTIAGIDTVNGGGYNGDNILAIDARLEHPSCITFDGLGNLYISDQSLRIRKINTQGIITTIAGTGETGYTGDGGLAINAQIGDPIGIIADKMGNIYFTDIDNNVVRKVDINGIITTVAGNGTAGYTGDDGPAKLATLNFPGGVLMSKDGTLLIADTYNNVIRKVDTAGIITTVIGDGSAGFGGDGGPAKNAKLYYPVALAYDNMNDLIIADYGNARIRKVILGPLPISLTLLEAGYHDNNVRIDWQTASEVNAAYFNVQRSKDGTLFTTIARVDARGNSSSLNSYHYVDEDTNNSGDNIVYFRLQSIDKNGTGSYSKIVTVNLKNAGFTLYPNPAKNMLRVKLSSGKREMVTIQISDMQGRVVKRLTTQLLTGANNISVNIETLPKGSYTLEIKGTLAQFRKFVKS